ncbi:MarR family winged helix-turn-helix transcriptional regulator, partial [Streptomyces sp. NPDC057638]|uniref:MarR family winged helix-turn-helix transcriptional regulator n=1 Tax=Streptomyces sp. NPDC057638 TaxID=3346190 RepID=UPI00368A44F0
MTPETTGGSVTTQPTGCEMFGPVNHVVAKLARLHRMAAAKLLRAHGLYPGQEFLLMRLWDAGPVRQSELIKVLDLDPSTVTKMLQRLEHSGHVRRSPDPHDRRAVLVEATEKSCALRVAVADSWAELERQTLQGLAEDEREEFVRLLGKAAENLCRETAAECGA